MSFLNRRQVVRACKARGWTIQPTALEEIEAYFAKRTQSTNRDKNDELQNILDSLSVEMKKQNKQTVTSELLKICLIEADDDQEDIQVTQMVDKSRKAELTKKKKRHVSAFGSLEVVNAFETPRLVYEVMRKQFRVEEKRWPLLGSAEDKIDMLAQRYALIHQRILRHALFRPTNLSHSNGGTSSNRAIGQHKLTPIESLLGGGTGGSRNSNSVLLLGILIQIEEGQYYLEDQTGQVPVAFQDSVVVDGFFVTEHCILLVEGSFQDGIFYIDRLGQPLQETRELSLKAIQQQVSHPAFVTAKISPNQDSPPFVVLSDVHLDQPRVLLHLEGLFATYENYSPDRVPCFILMGNFCSNISNHSHQQQQNYLQYSVGPGRTVSALEELMTLIDKFPNLARHAHFCLVPGPNDYGLLGSAHLHVLPLPPLDRIMKTSLSSISSGKNLHHLHHCSNPCRIRWSGQEIVVFRYDLLNLMQQSQVLLQQKAPRQSEKQELSMSMDVNSDDEYHRLSHCRLIKTVLDQGHLVPISNVPIYWNYDSALRLYPLPDALVLGGDGTSQAYHEIYGGCHVIHPGCFTNTVNSSANTLGGNYAIFTPGINKIADYDSDSSFTDKNTVELLQVGSLVTT